MPCYESNPNGPPGYFDYSGFALDANDCTRAAVFDADAFTS